MALSSAPVRTLEFILSSWRIVSRGEMCLGLGFRIIILLYVEGLQEFQLATMQSVGENGG